VTHLRPRTRGTSQATPLSRSVTYLLLGMGSVAVLGPFLWMLRSVFMPSSILYSAESTAHLIPPGLSLENLRAALTEGVQPFYVYFLNSVIVTGIAVLSNVVFCGLAGYALARWDFFGRRALLTIVILMLGVPIESRVIPLYIFSVESGLANTYLGIALPLLVTSFGIVLMRQYVLSIPSEIDEAAKIDGCSDWQLYWRVIFPICRPVLAAIAVFSFLAAWNDYLWPLVITSSQDMQTLPVAVANLAVVKEQLQWGALLAFSLLSVLPVMVFYLFLQRQFIAGLTGGAVKG
jgi:multiple sugar transport system permease protein